MEDEKKLERILKEIKWFAIISVVIAIVILIFRLPSQIMVMSSGLFVKNVIVTIIANVISIALWLVTAIGCNKKKMYGPICGIVIGIISILSFEILSVIIGLAMLIDCVRLIDYMKKRNIS